MYKKNYIKIIILIFLFCGIVFVPAVFCRQLDYYPIIFVHGHGGGDGIGTGGNRDIEATWKCMVEEKLNGQDGYTYQGKIWEKSSLPSNLPKKSIFLFGYYRESSSTSFGHIAGKIGGLSKRTDSDYLSRVSYAYRLGVAVHEVLRATGASKVILVGHSMGGLVCRAYIRYYDGADTVYKVLTVGTPNSGIPDDARMFLAKATEPNDWQDNGEYVEMSKNGNFEGRSYTSWLNDGWQTFCQGKGIKYATIRGNYNPWALVRIGDGVVDECDATLDGGAFNGCVYAAHCNADTFLPIVANNNFPDEMSLLKSSYVVEVIKRWILRDEVHNNAEFEKPTADSSKYILNGPNPFGGKSTLLQFLTKSGNAVMADVVCVNIAGEIIGPHNFFPLFPGDNFPVINFGERIANGVYVAYIKAYDMNGEFFNEKIKLAALDDRENIGTQPIDFTLNQKPEEVTSSRDAHFEVSVSGDNVLYSYTLDAGTPVLYNAGKKTFSFTGLEDGLHTVVVGVRKAGYAETHKTYTWLVQTQPLPPTPPLSPILPEPYTFIPQITSPLPTDPILNVNLYDNFNISLVANDNVSFYSLYYRKQGETAWEPCYATNVLDRQGNTWENRINIFTIKTNGEYTHGGIEDTKKFFPEEGIYEFKILAGWWNAKGNVDTIDSTGLMTIDNQKTGTEDLTKIIKVKVLGSYPNISSISLGTHPSNDIPIVIKMKIPTIPTGATKVKLYINGYDQQSEQTIISGETDYTFKGHVWKGNGNDTVIGTPAGKNVVISCYLQFITNENNSINSSFYFTLDQVITSNPETITLTQNDNIQNVYVAKTSIEARDNFTIENNQNIQFKSGATIILKPNFHAKSGSNFNAVIDPSLVN